MKNLQTFLSAEQAISTPNLENFHTNFLHKLVDAMPRNVKILTIAALLESAPHNVVSTIVSDLAEIN